MPKTRSRYTPPPLSQRQQEELTRQRAVERQQELERLYPSAADLAQRHQAEQEDGMRRMLGSSEDGRAWAQEVAAKQPRASHGPGDEHPAWVVKAAERSRPLDRVQDDEEW
ncbi:hypothetical protein ACQP0U_24030 [Micromonospora sp. CA-269861]|uniref:hypothetical protein n=1 Tax=Micromonospora sp. CA-269861 TaxID=3239968 RepID=UPI003D919DCD